MAAETPQQPPPNFGTSFTTSSLPFYFHYIINADEATLTVEVIGPNLQFTFRHSRAKCLLNRSNILRIMEQRTVGFITLAQGSDRHIMAWAESGHGSGRLGDILDAPAQSPVLPNRVWARRVARIGKVLGFKMGSPYDGIGYRLVNTGADLRGIFCGSHVEVKLAVFAVCFLLKAFGITDGLDNIKRRHLRNLRHVRWKDGTRPSFEIYFSRKNCQRCGSLIKTLSEFTGIPLKISWKDRLTEKVYENPSRPICAKGQKHAITIHDDEVIDFEGVIIIEEDYFDTTVDITRDGPEDSAMVIDGNVETMDLITPESSPDFDTAGGAAIDGVADFIQTMSEHADNVDSSLNPVTPGPARRDRTLREREDRNILKPMPPTPVNESPTPVNESHASGFTGTPPRQHNPSTPHPRPRTRSSSPKRATQQSTAGERERS